MTQPRLPEIGVLALVPDRWSARWATRHHVLSRLARHFHVVWVNPAREWREIGTEGTPVGEGAGVPLEVYEPEFWLPKLYRPAWLARLASEQRLRRARALLERQGCRRTVLYLWRPNFAPALASVLHDLSCYHIDDEYSFSTVDRPIDAKERRLISAVDQVFIHSPALIEKKGSINPHTELVPNGVDYDAYAGRKPEPADLASIPHPRIGYTGVIKTQLDWALLHRLADRHSEWSFVFVGPLASQTGIAALAEDLGRRDNVHFLGGKPTRVLTAYPQHFDVCIMPYVVDDYTRYIYPLKLHEYLASGRPVVGTPIYSLQAFADVVRLASTPDEWSGALARALHVAGVAPPARARRQAVARQHDWDRLVERIADTICARMEERSPLENELPHRPLRQEVALGSAPPVESEERR